VLTRGQLIDRLYTDDRLPALERTVDVHVFRLREKLHDANATATIVTIRGVGYKIMPDSA
jgi:DNA-binding response OmpR family regulator